MEKIFKELPIAFPFYQDVKSQEYYKENVSTLFYKLICPQNGFLPFQIQLPSDKPAPIKWEVFGVDNEPIIDITNNLNKIKIYNFADFKQAVYFGDVLQFVYMAVNEELKMPCGHYYTKITFADDSYYASEIFYVEKDLQDFIKVDFWNDKDVLPVIYRDEWKQTLYLPTFIHTATPEIEEESLKDGYNSEIPSFQKMMRKYKFTDIVPDFLKTALVSLQIQDFVYLWISETRQGYVDRVWVAVTPDDSGEMSEVEVTFEDDVMIKTNCNENKPLLSVSNW